MATSAKVLQQVKKKWVQIYAPSSLHDVFLGETYVGDFNDAVGKDITVSLMTLTGEPQKQNIMISFRMTGVRNNTIVTETIGYKMIPSAVRKTMRRGKEKIEDSFNLSTQDNVKVLVKPLFVTKGRTSNSVLANLRRTARVQIAKTVSSSKFESLIYDLITQKFQKTLGDVLRKIYPLSTCEIKYFSAVKKTNDGASPKSVENVSAVKETVAEPAVAATAVQ